MDLFGAGVASLLTWRSHLLLVHILQIGIPVQPLFIELQQRAALLIRQPPFAQRGLDVLAQRRHAVVSYGLFKVPLPPAAVSLHRGGQTLVAARPQTNLPT